MGVIIMFSTPLYPRKWGTEPLGCLNITDTRWKWGVKAIGNGVPICSDPSKVGTPL